VKESWSARASAGALTSAVHEWDPDLVEMMQLVPDGACIDWSLRWRDPQPQWASQGGRVVQLGDSAHAFLPTSGNGATQACEDALSLSMCLRMAGKGKEHVATKVHAKLRFERVSTIQKFGVATRNVLHQIDFENPDVLTRQMTMPEWIWSHNPSQYAVENYQNAEQHIVRGTPFHNTNLWPGFVYEPWTVAGEIEKAQQAGS
jgi:2-polyprenyl-6-methoxyphenol hydroxylase-like FAD-dependent oxidoreductase